jgi:hypothetical protein
MHTYKPDGESSPSGGGCNMAPTDSPGVHYCREHCALHFGSSVICDSHGPDDLMHLFREVVHAWSHVKRNRPEWPVLYLVLDVSEEPNHD